MWNVTTKVIPETTETTGTTQSYLEHTWVTNQKSTTLTR